MPARLSLADWRDAWPWLASLASVALLVVLAVLQFRWLEQVAEAERNRTAVALRDATVRLSVDFNRELGSLFLAFQSLRVPDRDPGNEAGDSSGDDFGAGLAEGFRRWQGQAAWPELVAAVYLRTLPDDELRQRVRSRGPEAGDRGAGEGAPEELPEDSLGSIRRLGWLDERPEWRVVDRQELETAHPRLAEAFERARGSSHRELVRHLRGDRRGPPPGPRMDLLMAEVPALLVPVHVLAPFSGSEAFLPQRRSADRSPPTLDRRRRQRFRQESRQEPRPGGSIREAGVVIVILDREQILGTILPALVERHFGVDPGVRIEVSQPSETGDELLFAVGPSAPGAAAEVGEPLFGPLDLDGRQDPRLGRWVGALAALAELDEGRWRLVVRHPAGSLEEAVARTQRRNLAVVSAILAVLAGALTLLSVGWRRARRLAHQQLDFVAGVTHELMTPVAALRSAGQNLADGVVRDPEQVVRYGRMIDLEGRRLADQVGQVLAFARMQASRPRLDLRSLDAGEQVAEVVRELRPILESAGVELEMEVEEGLPAVWAEGQALRRCLSNLVVNATKYGQRPGAEAWVGLDVVAVGDRVRFRARDRGPGIDPRDRPHLFEPFYRGRGMAASAVPGSGLGLALVRHLVEAQGGRVGLESEPGRGTEVWIELPTAEGMTTTGDASVEDSMEESR